ncbi:hypothetical protein AYL99_11685 [Fonsecaea erecta]|uniref:Restriction endonuclease domain-containing protein n=1 Tax=Fonsecaea erecta TaxID=1367422 RepID=A0A178Z305_9EURO|nr:hypothetical protein AYL99_11685 [Fonsecaea erecta]OAP54150.1 hypothetical protein AYL99_11685 [Fonsecaea erecta]
MDSRPGNAPEPLAPGRAPGSLSFSEGDTASASASASAQPGCEDQIIEFFLPAEQYRQLTEELERCDRFAGSRVRADYSYTAETLALRMPGPRHERVVRYFNYRLDYFIDGLDMIEDTVSLQDSGSGKCEYLSKDGKGLIERHPNISIINTKNPAWPVLVCEVADSQKTKDLHGLAREYIEQTKGNIRTVVTIDFDYPTGKRVYLIVWRASFGEDGRFKEVACGDVVEIRNRDGNKNPDPDAGVSLSLSDFGLTRGVDTSADNQVFTVSVDDLYTKLQIIERQIKQTKAARNDTIARWKAGAEV